MFKEQMNKIKSLIIKDKGENGEEREKPNKRKIENLVVFLIILIITLIAINTILSKDDVEKNEETESSYKVLANSKEDNNKSMDGLEQRLEKILSTIVGVRKIKCTN